VAEVKAGEATAVIAVDSAVLRRSRRESHPPIVVAQDQQIGQFGLIREIARGGMGQVFLARDTKLGRKVAIKFLLDGDPSFVSRFLIEARATARCTHENIVTIHDVGEHQGLPFMVLEYLEGKTLTQLLKAKPIGVRPFAELMVPVVRALERAHEHGIVHRDLKPSNILVTERGLVKVLDFGVAKCFETPAEPVGHRVLEATLRDETYVTAAGSGWIVGTLPYMSPEQWGAGEVDHQSDLWAVGIMFWQALTGAHPIGTSSPDKLHAQLTDLDAAMPSIAARGVPAGLAAIVDRCLAKRKAERYLSATELLEDLQGFLYVRARASGDTCPYRGLAAFGEPDAKYFFGRSSEIRTALAQLDAWPLLAVIGPSGVGKSSFVHAGLIPAVRATDHSWQVRVLRPGRTPLQSLASVLGDETATIGDAPGQFGELLRREAKRQGHRLLIVVDQLEELFTLSDDAAARELFVAALLAAADDPSAPVRVVLSMRADFLDRLAGDKHFLSELSRGLFFLAAPDRDNLRELLVRPAELVGYAFEEPSIVDDMIEAATSRGALPLLQFAATRLWDTRDRERKVLTRKAYEAMGGVGGAFVRHADEIAAAVPAHGQALLRTIMTRLVTPEGTRAVVDHAELLTLADETGETGEIERILDKLVGARLIHIHTDPTEGASVEIVHEALIGEWPMLRRWLDDNQALRGFVHELRQAARQWASHGKPGDLVWRGATAQEALALTQRHALDLAATERAFLAAIRAQASRGRRRKMLAFVSICTVLGLVIVGGAVAVVRISSAEAIAHEQAAAAGIEAQRARKAEAETAQELVVLKAEEDKRAQAEAEVSHQSATVRLEEQKRAQAEASRKSAETEASRANAAVKMSREELEVTNLQLEGALEASRRDRTSMQQAVEQAQAAADAAKLASEAAIAASAKLQAQLAAEKAHVKQLERDQGKLEETLK
jgi:eukaryotic-like serine/threonine-protein kinase